jgi:predicted transcriptional regulator
MAKTLKAAEKCSAILKEIVSSFGALDVPQIAQRLDTSERNIYRHLRNLISDKTIMRVKRAEDMRGYLYFLLPQAAIAKEYPTGSFKDESAVFYHDFKDFIVQSGANQNAFNAFSYVFGEMLNNAMDHSDSQTIKINVAMTAISIRGCIEDDGVGIFSKIQKSMGLEDIRYSILELAKGKFTTDPKSHTGEGIFFSSKLADRFYIQSDALVFNIAEGTDFLQNLVADQTKTTSGTLVAFEIFKDKAITAEEIFNRYTEYPDSYGFNKTVIPVYLLEYQEDNPTFNSRSQAKRLLVRIERFQQVILDFQKIESIGQGFADEVFRVFAHQHPQCHIQYLNASPKVERMIKHVLN